MVTARGSMVTTGGALVTADCVTAGISMILLLAHASGISLRGGLLLYFICFLTFFLVCLVLFSLILFCIFCSYKVWCSNLDQVSLNKQTEDNF